jgi:hypothetical protein
MSASSYASDFSGVPHIVDPTGAVAVYWTDPPGALVQLVQSTRGTSEMAHWLVNDAMDLLFSRFPGVDGLRIVIDMRRMTGRSAMARSMLMNAGGTAAGRIGHVVMLPSLHMGPAYLKVIEATAVALRLIGYRVDVEHNLDEALKRYGVHIEMLSDVRAVLKPQLKPD